MTISLERMTQLYYDNFYENSIYEYANEHIKSGNWKKEGAIARARKAFENLLPNGLATDGEYLFSIFNSNENIGYCWLHFSGDNNKSFIYDIHIDEKFRGEGLGEAAMLGIENYCKERKVQSIGLHVFGHNQRAVSLYNKMGFQVTNYRMEKVLDEG